MSCTIVLVHGAFAESASWDGVIDPLVAQGHRVVAAPDPLRGVAADAQSVTDLVRTIEGPIVLVAHSYGGSVISGVDAIIPAALQRHMAERARAQRTVAVARASHAATVSQPAAVAELILEAARLPTAA